MSESNESDHLRLARELAESYRKDARKKPRRQGTSQPEQTRDVNEDGVLVSGIMRDLVKQQGWTKNLAGTRVFSDWPAIVGQQISENTKVEHFSDGVVHVSARSTAWAKELTMLAPRIVAKLNEHLGDGEVQRIEVKGPRAYSWKSGPRSVKGRGPRDTYG
ncbi:MAG: DUF721 domain-containing protein [Actinomycetales bacterium]|nr:DUF721 domain-containing protein [Actinomycetales bacterium]